MIVDGAKALETAVTQTFGRAAVVQRCQVHKGWNILEHLPEAQRPWVKAIRSGPRNLDSGLSEISIVFQAAVPKLVASK